MSIISDIVLVREYTRVIDQTPEGAYRMMLRRYRMKIQQRIRVAESKF